MTDTAEAAARERARSRSTGQFGTREHAPSDTVLTGLPAPMSPLHRLTRMIMTQDSDRPVPVAEARTSAAAYRSGEVVRTLLDSTAKTLRTDRAAAAVCTTALSVLKDLPRTLLDTRGNLPAARMAVREASAALEQRKALMDSYSPSARKPIVDALEVSLAGLQEFLNEDVPEQP